ncbi:hypothetical protein BH10ACT9_BH10ACT9_58110 [soil metagenome]
MAHTRRGGDPVPAGTGDAGVLGHQAHRTALLPLRAACAIPAVRPLGVGSRTTCSVIRNGLRGSVSGEHVVSSVTAGYVTDVSTGFTCPICRQETTPTAEHPAVRCEVRIAWRQGRRRGWQSSSAPICAQCASMPNRLSVESGGGSVQADLPQGELDRGQCEACGLHVAVRRDPRRRNLVCGNSCRQRLYQESVEPTVTSCERCGNEFTARRGARWCSSACRQKAYRDRTKVGDDGR